MIDGSSTAAPAASLQRRPEGEIVSRWATLAFSKSRHRAIYGAANGFRILLTNCQLVGQFSQIEGYPRKSPSRSHGQAARYSYLEA